MDKTELMKDVLKVTGIAPIIAYAEPEQAVPAAKALVAGGLPVVEVLMRNEHAMGNLERIARDVPEIVAGAGTIITLDQAKAAIDHGAQFIIMPVLAFLLVTLFQLPTELAVGVILVGACPGGTSSNVMTYLAKGDVALSVGMTACTTIMAPFVTPALVLLLAGQTVDVSYVSMLVSIVQVVLVPIALGFVINYFFSKFAQAFSKALPLISVIAICLIIMAVVSANAAKLMTTGPLVVAVVMLHNVCGYALGYLAGRLLGLTKEQMRTLSIEVGMQNSGLATSLATMHFAAMPMAAVPGTVFSVWHNISGAVYANILARTAEGKKDEAHATEGARA